MEKKIVIIGIGILILLLLVLNFKPKEQFTFEENPLKSYCELNEGVYKELQDSETCTFENSYCYAWDFFEGRCKEGDNPI